MAGKIEKLIAETFLEMAEGLESGNYGKKPRIALTGMGSEHGEENAMRAAVAAAKDGIEVWYIGSLEGEGVNAIRFAAELVRGKVFEVARQEFERANKAGLKELLASLKSSAKGKSKKRI